jgi:hypothetical protein
VYSRRNTCCKLHRAYATQLEVEILVLQGTASLVPRPDCITLFGTPFVSRDLLIATLFSHPNAHLEVMSLKCLYLETQHGPRPFRPNAALSSIRVVFKILAYAVSCGRSAYYAQLQRCQWVCPIVRSCILYHSIGTLENGIRFDLLHPSASQPPHNQVLNGAT